MEKNKDMELDKRLHELMCNEDFSKYEGGIYDDAFDAKLVECLRQYAEEMKLTETMAEV